MPYSGFFYCRSHCGITIKYTGGDKAIIYSKNWKKIDEIEIDSDAVTLSQGKHLLSFDCKFADSKEVHVKLEIRFIGKAETVKVN